MSAPKTPAALVRKLHGWELLHLREHSANLEAEIEALRAENERLRRELQHADDCADSWRDDVMRMQEEGTQLGLTESGHVVLLRETLPDSVQALRRRGRMGILLSAAGVGRDRFDWWCGYARALRDLERGAGATLARKDAKLPYEPLGGFTGAAVCLDQDIEALSRFEVQQLLAQAGVQLSADAAPDADLAVQQLEHGEIAAVVNADGEHAAAQVVLGDGPLEGGAAHAGSVATGEALQAAKGRA